jgi:hypothetical protein
MTSRLVLLTLALATPAAAQQPATPQAPSQTAAGPMIPNAPASIAVGSRVGELMSSYDSGGRRDPFGSLVTPKRAANAEGARQRPPAGLAGVALADVLVRGVVRNGNTMLAILEGPNRQSYVSRVNDRLLDATIVRIDADGVIFGEQAERGMAPNHLRKSLRPAGDQVQ